MIVEVNGRRAAFRTDEPTAVFTGAHVAHRVSPGSATHGPDGELRAVVEILRPFGGTMARALLGAAFSPRPAGSATIYEVRSGTALELGSAAACASRLGGPLVAGLPVDFADAVLDGLTENAADAPLPSGVLRVDRAAFDELYSSELSFRLVAALLHRAVRALLYGTSPAEALRTTLNAW
ncbi:hypothetical protein [Streptomyces sp. CA-111067]|uniref:hypothetical protein n=1 Tax=Streptomyces sp. CA-111067 TaxID=3240046 RepID=UPI003D99F366